MHIEHTFVLSGDFLLDDARATERACDLIERLSEEIIRARHSWQRVQRLAQDLSQLAGMLASLAASAPPLDGA